MVELKDYYTINSIYEESLETIMIYTGLKDLSLIEKVALRRIIQVHWKD
ncbi:hypothetical protein HZA96_01285 [Candidatus Woesearchaeota archaeon]|nr:hypothetical protein [Candidatus Woesearchaeota archaeon]